MSQSLTGASNVPKITWEYWGWIETMQNNPGMYVLENRRTDCHNRLCEYYKISKEQSRTITDNLNKYRDAVDLHFALVKLQEK
jgi:hypothetical protein